MKARTILSATLLLSGALAGCGDGVSTEGRVEPGAPAIRVDNQQQGGGGIPTTDAQAIKLTGDFNGDGVGDLIVVTNQGSFEYLGSKSGQFTGGAWDGSLLTLGTVTYTVGDFNGDQASDIMITTVFGSTLFTGQFGASGGFTATGATNPLSLGAGLAGDPSVRFTVGDFDGNGKSDLIITTIDGSWECLYVDAGGFLCPSFLQPLPWVDSNLTLNHVRFASGDFNGDGVSDLVFADATGAHEYTGLRAGGFTPDVWTDSSLTDTPRSHIELVPGDFNGDGTADLIVATTTGSTEYLGNRAGGFTSAWSRPDLTASNPTQYFPGDFNGDGTDDLIIQTSEGAFEYTGKVGGGFNPDVYVRYDLGVNNALFWPSDYNGDGVTDLILATPSGSYEYTGNKTGAPFNGVWHRPDLTLGSVQYF